MDRIADFIWTGRKVKLSFFAEYRTACYVAPLIRKMVAETDDGETYRTAVIEWHKAERPPLAIYHGDTSFCRIDGPNQWVNDQSFPLGGLILSPGVTAHLNPFEAHKLREHLQGVIEEAILTWIADHNLRGAPPVPEAFNRQSADRKAKAMLAKWASNSGGKQWANLGRVKGSHDA
jgi:hypothetical protein